MSSDAFHQPRTHRVARQQPVPVLADQGPEAGVFAGSRGHDDRVGHYAAPKQTKPSARTRSCAVAKAWDAELPAHNSRCNSTMSASVRSSATGTTDAIKVLVPKEKTAPARPMSSSPACTADNPESHAESTNWRGPRRTR